MSLMVLNKTISYINHVFDLCGLSFEYHSKAIVAWLYGDVVTKIFYYDNLNIPSSHIGIIINV